MGQHVHVSGMGLLDPTVDVNVKNYEEITLPLNAAIEAPLPGAVLSGSVLIKGYATGNILSGNLVVDGVPGAPISIGPRSDIASRFGLPTTKNLGFQVTLDTRLLSEGAHSVSVSLLASAFVVQRLIGDPLLMGLGQETTFRLAPPQTVTLAVTGSDAAIPPPTPTTSPGPPPLPIVDGGPARRPGNGGNGVTRPAPPGEWIAGVPNWAVLLAAGGALYFFGGKK